MNRRIVLVAAAWLFGAALTATAAAAAVNAVGSGLLGQSSPVLSQDEVQRRLSGTAQPESPGVEVPTGTPSAAGPSPSGDTPSPAAARVLATAGGTVVARCAAGQVSLVSWSPAQGYRTDDVNRGPAAAASVKFKSSDTEVTVTATCVGDEPQAATATDNRHGH